MRPQEILGMMEEAAGTRMFEDRKEKAKRTMGKKEKRVEEINEVCNPRRHPSRFCTHSVRFLYCSSFVRKLHPSSTNFGSKSGHISHIRKLRRNSKD